MIMLQHVTGNTALRTTDPHRCAWLVALVLAMLAHSAVAYWLTTSASSTPAPATRTVDVMLMAAPPPLLSAAAPAEPEPARRPAQRLPHARTPAPAAPLAPQPVTQEQSIAEPAAAVETANTSPEPPPSAVDFSADYLQNTAPVYPLSARRRGLEGQVLVHVQVLENGHSGAVDIKLSSGHESLDNAALHAIQEWRFVPATRGGHAIMTWVEIPIHFKLEH